MEKIITKICIKLFSKDHRTSAVISGVIGFILLFGSAGATDNGAELTEIMIYIISGFMLMALSFAYILFYEYVWSE